MTATRVKRVEKGCTFLFRNLQKEDFYTQRTLHMVNIQDLRIITYHPQREVTHDPPQRTIRCRSTRTHYPASEPTNYLFLQINAGCLKKSNRYQLYSLGLTRSGLKPMTHLTRDHHANHYTIDAVPEYWQYKL